MSEDTQPMSGAVELTLATRALFSSGATTFTLPVSNREINIKNATVKQLGPLMRFFQRVVGEMDTSQLEKMIDMIVSAQRQAIAEGRDPTQLDMSSSDLVRKATGNASLLAQLFAATLEELPSIVPLFVDMTADEFENLQVDDAMLVAGSIFMVNYDFFTRSLLPTLMGFITSWASRRNVANAPTNRATQILKTGS